MICLIVDHHPVISSGLAQMVRASFPGWQVDIAHTVAAAIEQAGAHQPDVVLISLLMPDNSGLALLGHLQQHDPNSRRTASIVIADAPDAETARLCERLGAHGFMSRAHAFTAIAAAIRAVCARQKYFEPAPDTATPVPAPIRFTPRQRDIVDLLLIGYSNKQIACTLNLSSGTVKNYIFDLMRMISVSSRLEMALKIRDSGYQRS
ncbi:UNVERIFIED_ORG: two-component system nitrate/nitrite response regulator NarL [Zoogloea ramigera]|uniref:Response regulator transcription factor n=1 Tax=Duganella zoogloeoides TaxID=75659 RepID=A0ABZ0Y5W1_9BURK|nr:response regulator transcription factor [Duganella zoogloeoides]WQH07456.1 response regulator transcription factor [Duganella zoogloeoides]